MDMKNRYQYQFVESLESYASDEILEAVKSNYAKFITSKEDKDENNVCYVFEFVNNDIGKKLKLSVTIPSRFLLLKIDNL
ncbi:hypothetical protein Ddc_17562 [Ditylenchus destructor]|nr:hypothetical protein Ddc_17562 [Ditylenchus destructor]